MRLVLRRRRGFFRRFRMKRPVRLLRVGLRRRFRVLRFLLLGTFSSLVLRLAFCESERIDFRALLLVLLPAVPVVSRLWRAPP